MRAQKTIGMGVKKTSKKISEFVNENLTNRLAYRVREYMCEHTDTDGSRRSVHVRDVADGLGLSTSTVHRILRVMRQQDLAVSRADESDESRPLLWDVRGSPDEMEDAFGKPLDGCGEPEREPCHRAYASIWDVARDRPVVVPPSI